MLAPRWAAHGELGFWPRRLDPALSRLTLAADIQCILMPRRRRAAVVAAPRVLGSDCSGPTSAYLTSATRDGFDVRAVRTQAGCGMVRGVARSGGWMRRCSHDKRHLPQSRLAHIRRE